MSVRESSFLITNFSDFTNHRWRIINDGVMGGFSRSRIQLLPNNHLLFMGDLTTENQGGFASVKNRHSLNLKGYNTLILKVKGDGKQYNFRFKTSKNDHLNDWSYESSFWTLSGQWQTIELPFNEFYPVYRGKRLKDLPAPELDKIQEYGLMISNRQEGLFQIEIKSLEAVVKSNFD